LTDPTGQARRDGDTGPEATELIESILACLRYNGVIDPADQVSRGNF